MDIDLPILHGIIEVFDMVFVCQRCTILLKTTLNLNLLHGTQELGPKRPPISPIQLKLPDMYLRRRVVVNGPVSNDRND